MITKSRVRYGSISGRRIWQLGLERNPNRGGAFVGEGEVMILVSSRRAAPGTFFFSVSSKDEVGTILHSAIRPGPTAINPTDRRFTRFRSQGVQKFFITKQFFGALRPLQRFVSSFHSFVP